MHPRMSGSLSSGRPKGRTRWLMQATPVCWLPNSVHEAGARRLLQRGGERAIFLAVGAGQCCNPAQMILRLIAVTLFDLPQSVILPGLDVAGVGLQRALVPDLRYPVVAELAVGIADQIGDGGVVVVAERLELVDRGGIVVAVVDHGIGGAVAGGELAVLDGGALVLLVLLGARGRR